MHMVYLLLYWIGNVAVFCQYFLLDLGKAKRFFFLWKKHGLPKCFFEVELPLTAFGWFSVLSFFNFVFLMEVTCSIIKGVSSAKISKLVAKFEINVLNKYLAFTLW